MSADPGVARRAVLVAALSQGVVVTGCAARGSGPQSDVVLSSLPAPRRDGGPALTDVLARRSSVRTFTAESLSRTEIGQLLWAAQGVTHGAGYRTAPSAGALYPLDLYVATRPATLHYLPDGHRVEEWRPAGGWEFLVVAATSSEPVRQAAAVVLVAAAVRRTAVKYGGRAERYATLEAGHATQNLVLQATALGLGAVTLGAFDETRVATYFAVAPGRTPLYLVPVGRPTG